MYTLYACMHVVCVCVCVCVLVCVCVCGGHVCGMRGICVCMCGVCVYVCVIYNIPRVRGTSVRVVCAWMYVRYVVCAWMCVWYVVAV